MENFMMYKKKFFEIYFILFLIIDKIIMGILFCKWCERIRMKMIKNSILCFEKFLNR